MKPPAYLIYEINHPKFQFAVVKLSTNQHLGILPGKFSLTWLMDGYSLRSIRHTLQEADNLLPITTAQSRNHVTEQLHKLSRTHPELFI
jgi:hypothetical protein